MHGEQCCSLCRRRVVRAVVIECNECANRTCGERCAESFSSHSVLIFVFFFLVAVMLCVRCILFLISLPLSSLPSFTRFIYSRARDGWRTNRTAQLLLATVLILSPATLTHRLLIRIRVRGGGSGNARVGASIPAGFLHFCVQDHHPMKRTKLVAPKLCAHVN